MLDYVGVPTSKKVLALRSEVKRSLNLLPGAPEIVLHVLSRATIDPYSRWVLTMLHVWHESAKHEDAKELLDDPKGPRVSRFTSLKIACAKMDWKIDSKRLTTPYGNVPFHRPWDISRPTIVTYLKRHAWDRLAERRKGNICRDWGSVG